MTIVWREIARSPRYEVNAQGEIRNTKYNRILTPSKNQEGHLKLNLPNEEGKIKTRQVNHIVAEAFIPEPHRDDFISLIHLDGDKTDCAAPNLQWRPRYFAIRYHLQFTTDIWRENHTRIVDTKNGRVYETIQEAAVEHGLVLSEILVAAHNRTFVWPTYQQFRLLD
jgi:hypothetical protein